jgi:putative FmdB family regulatory protein
MEVDMPIYEYLCYTCGAQEDRVAGLDDKFATCVSCGGRMERLGDPFCPRCYPVTDQDPAPELFSHKNCPQHAAALLKEV